ncbi:MAG: membrane protein insertase YidC [Actinomycetota bacterium]
MFALLGAAVSAVYHVLTATMQILAPVTGGLSAAAAIVAVTIAVRLLLLPLSYYAIRGQASQARLLPQVAELQRRHRRDPDRLRSELAALYQRENTSALAGCLPVLLQWPFFSVLYRLFLDHKIGGQPNVLLSHRLFGAPLGSHWLTGPGPLSGQGAVFLGLMVLLAAVAWAATRGARRVGATGVTGVTGATGATGATQPAAGRPGSGQPTAGQAAVPGWLVRVLPYATVVIAAFVPLAAGLSLLTTTAWTAAERFVIQRRLLSTSQPSQPVPLGQPGQPGQRRADPGRPGPASA